MRIQGLQKLTLLDYPGKVACTVFTAGCNFRCPFCHNASLVMGEVQEPEITEEAFFSFLKKRQGILDGVCVTGGEPLLQKEIELFLRKIKELGYLVKLDTNGSFPKRLRQLVEAGLVDYVAMDVKNSKKKYAETCGVEQIALSEVEESIAFLLQGTVPYEFRTTVTWNFHELDDFIQIGQWIAGAEHYFLQAFVDSGDLIEGGIQGYEKEELETFLAVIRQTIPNAEIRGI